MRIVVQTFVSFIVFGASLSPEMLCAGYDVYVHPVPLKATDKLNDGREGNSIALKGTTTLVWVDLAPGMRFAHSTLYVLISGNDATIVKGQWWPEANGNKIAFGAVAPVRVSGGDAHPSFQQVDSHVHVCSTALRATDNLTDGPRGKPIKLDGETTMLWVDLMPGAWYAHPMLYILIAGDNGRVLKGGWPPYLNGEEMAITKAKTSVALAMSNAGSDAKKTAELCAGKYSAQQVSGTVAIFANGTHPTSGYEVRLEELPLDVFPPEFRLVHVKPTGAVLQLVTPFSVSATFKSKEPAKEVAVHDASGRHTVPVEQVPNAANK